MVVQTEILEFLKANNCKKIITFDVVVGANYQGKYIDFNSITKKLLRGALDDDNPEEPFDYFTDTTRVAMIGRLSKGQRDLSLVVATRDTAKEKKLWEKLTLTPMLVLYFFMMVK